MTTATFASHSPRFGGMARSHARAGREAWFIPAESLLLDAGDFCAVAFAFAFAAGLVLGGAVACDAYLVAVIRRGALDDFAAYQLARDLLPWALVFTAVAGGMAALGLRLACRLRGRSEPTGFTAGAV